MPAAAFAGSSSAIDAAFCRRFTAIAACCFAPSSSVTTALAPTNSCVYICSRFGPLTQGWPGFTGLTSVFAASIAFSTGIMWQSWHWMPAWA